MRPRHTLGPALIHRGIQAAVPYPADLAERDIHEPTRFQVYWCIDGYCIMDNQVDEDIFSEFHLITNEFDLVAWYTQQLAMLSPGEFHLV